MAKLIVPERRKSEVTAVDRIASVDGMADDLMTIVKNQIEQWRIKAGQGAIFDEKEIRIVQGLTKTLVEIEAMQRARLKSKEQDELLKNMTEEELKKYVR